MDNLDREAGRDCHAMMWQRRWTAKEGPQAPGSVRRRPLLTRVPGEYSPRSGKNTRRRQKEENYPKDISEIMTTALLVDAAVESDRE